MPDKLEAQDEKTAIKNNDDEKIRATVNAGLAGAASEAVQRYGEANKEHLVAYSGVDNATGKQLTRSLKKISKYKINPEFEKQNRNQHAGFSAEVKEVARENAERIINKDNTRVSRTDDLGRVNDPLYDHVELDRHGKEIAGSGSQMKFVGDTPEKTLEKLSGKKFQKYLDNDAPFKVSADFYDGVKKAANEKIAELQKNVDALQIEGKMDIAQQQLDKIEKYKKIRDTLEKSHLSKDEAIEACGLPVLSTAKDIARISHKAGIEQAGYGAAIGGGISIIRNIVAVVKDEKSSDEAALDVIGDAGAGALTSYVTAFSGSSLKGLMQNAKSGTMQTISKTNLPATIAVSVLEMQKTLSKYFRGDIDGAECLEELGEKGSGMLASAMFAVVGQAAIPIPVVGGMVGGMIGYALSSVFYNELTAALKAENFSYERRLRVEAECKEAEFMIREYRKEMEQLVSNYLTDHITLFHSSFDRIKEALYLGDIDGFISGVNRITEGLGRQPQFDTFHEFNKLMGGPETFKL
jgi:hypothetical protein